MTKEVADKVERVRHEAYHLFATTNNYHDLTLEHLGKMTGTKAHWLLEHVFPSPEWPTLRDAWAKKRLQQAMDEMYQAAQIREGFSAEQIGHQAGISDYIFLRLMGDEYTQHRASLPTLRDWVTILLWKLVCSSIPLERVARERICDAVGFYIHGSKWLTSLHRSAYPQLPQLQHQKALPPGASHLRLISSTWIDLDQDTWDLRAVVQATLKRSCLRSDIAPLAWPLLREELAAGKLSPGTIYLHYQAFLTVGKLLGEEVPDVCHASLPEIQRAWVCYSSSCSYSILRQARLALRRLFEARFLLLKEGENAERNKLLHIIGWLQASISLRHDETESVFLSEEELNTVLTACLADIRAGQAFTNTHDLLTQSTRYNPRDSESPRLVVYWAVALMILIMTCTGMRRESILSLETGDWMEVRPGLVGILWRHGKKHEENLAAASPYIADLLQQYVDATASLRTALHTKRVFLNGTIRSYWVPMNSVASDGRLREFTARHHLERDGKPLSLGSTVFRRTFSTRALYEGQSVEAIRSQLGHSTIMSTLIYIKFDMFEHPAQVRDALDIYGRHALTLWKTPVLLQSLPAEERRKLFQQSTERDQDVGLCRYDHCIQLDRGGPPPCSLCEHLVTGKAFLPAWHHELEAREHLLEQMKLTPESGVLYAQLKGQAEQFKRNLAIIETSSEE